MSAEDDDIHPNLTADEWVARMKAVVAAVFIKSTPAHTAPDAVTPEHMEKFRPARSAAKWLIDAPEEVIAIYDAGVETVWRYVIALGGRHWTAAYSLANWRQGLDPRSVLCIRIGYDPTTREVTAEQQTFLLSRKLGLKTRWLDLPPDVRRVITRHLHR